MRLHPPQLKAVRSSNDKCIFYSNSHYQTPRFAASQSLIMLTFGYHASHEQFSPAYLLQCVQEAQAAGFHAAMCSDHFFPWSEQQGQSGFAWAWLGAALQATDLSFGTVCAPGQRYHPAVIAQAAATLAEMFPERFWVALGSGEAINEHITGAVWPSKPQRNQRLRECADIMRRLWAGETVTHHGLVQVDRAKLYTRPDTPPLIVGAAVTAETAEWVAGWADAVITVSKSIDEQKRFIDAFRRGGGEGKPMFLQVKVSYHPDEQTARQGAYDQWRTNIFESSVLSDLEMPADFENRARSIRPEDMDQHVRISSSLDQHAGWLVQDIELGFERIYLHNVNREQQRFIEAFGQHIIPALMKSVE
jgi:coenzyme F420-dependent glucose-6-phosphate dehydrogenase